MNNVSFEIRNKVLERDNFTCLKCGFKDKGGKDLEIHHINPKIFNGNDNLPNLATLCSICHKHAPDNEKEFLAYISDKIDGNMLNTFRKSNYSIARKTKEGMSKSFREGKHITKAPLGYKLVNKKLLIDEANAQRVKDIFAEFLETNTSLTQLAKKHNITTSGLKKLLQNTTYLGKVKFAEQESQGTHLALIDEEIFQKIKEKLG